MVVVVVLGVGLVGCTPGGEATPSPSTGESTTVVATPSPSPTPQWTDEEQGAVDAVQRYLEVWTRIGQDPINADWGEFNAVAIDPAVSDALTIWNTWASQGWHLVNGPVFEPESVSAGVHDIDGQVFHVRGCFLLADGYVVDSSGNRLENNGDPRAVGQFDVLHTETRYVVVEELPKEGTC
ncbi:MAG: hypothetical protein LBI33_13515 [Propionibacteriaceae bacterium]|nr:hypothetical protein [Propionibacteriaceae bacterium]